MGRGDFLSSPWYTRDMNVNKATIVGRITSDLELKTTPAGRELVSFSLATNRNWTDDSGAKQEKTDFHNIVFWGKQAGVIAQYCVKGQELFVEGRLETRSWESEDGRKNYRTEIIGRDFQFGAKPGGYGGGGGPAPALRVWPTGTWRSGRLPPGGN